MIRALKDELLRAELRQLWESQLLEFHFDISGCKSVWGEYLDFFPVSPEINLHQFFANLFAGLRARRDHAYQVCPGLVGRAVDQLGVPVAHSRWIGWDWFMNPQKLWILSHEQFAVLADDFVSSVDSFSFHCRQFRSELILYLFYLISWAVWCMAGRDSCPPPPTLADDLRSVAGGD